MQDAIGDFPAKWNTNGSGEIVTISGKPGRWLKLAGSGFYLPEFITALPDDFTLEFDILTPPTFSGYYLNSVIAELPSGGGGELGRGDQLLHPEIASRVGGRRIVGDPGEAGLGLGGPINQVRQAIHEGGKPRSRLDVASTPAHTGVPERREGVGPAASVGDDSQVQHVPVRAARDDPKGEFYIGNLRLAVGAPDTRNKLLTDGKWVTHGILFDVNSDRVRPESYGALKEIVNVLTENADVKVQIVGHTDADGDDAKNLDLSKRRAASVRAVLAKEFAIAEDRMETDGKGESQPIDKNDTPAGKANNRRVEFVKL